MRVGEVEKGPLAWPCGADFSRPKPEVEEKTHHFVALLKSNWGSDARMPQCSVGFSHCFLSQQSRKWNRWKITTLLTLQHAGMSLFLLSLFYPEGTLRQSRCPKVSRERAKLEWLSCFIVGSEQNSISNGSHMALHDGCPHLPAWHWTPSQLGLMFPMWSPVWVGRGWGCSAQPAPPKPFPF